MEEERALMENSYQRLGLRSKLGNVTGGTEKTLSGVTAAREQAEKEAASAVQKLKPGEARIKRDADGKVIGVEYGKTAEEALNDSDDEEDSGPAPAPGIVKLLEEQAKLGYKRERTQSEREEEWIENLVAKHGDNYEKMFWDKRLNPFQQSVGDIKRRVIKWKKAKAKAAKTA